MVEPTPINFGARLSAVEAAVEEAGLKGGGSGGTSGGVTDDWKHGVDRQLEQLHKDVRNLLYGLIAGFLILAGAGYGLYNGLRDRVADQQVALEKLAGDVAVRDAAINGKIDLLLERTAPKK